MYLIDGFFFLMINLSYNFKHLIVNITHIEFVLDT